MNNHFVLQIEDPVNGMCLLTCSAEDPKVLLDTARVGIEQSLKNREELILKIFKREVQNG